MESDIRRYSRGEIAGITVANVTGVYNGNPYKIEIQGLTEGDMVYYALAGGADMKYSETQPDMTNAGTYRVRYRVDREGVGTHEGIATVTIAKAEPEYTIPQECKGKCGGMLASLMVTGIGNYKGKLVKKFTIVPKGTSISGAVKAQKKSLTVKWKKQKKSIDGYEIWCSTSKKFTKSATVKKTAKKTAVKLTVKKLKARTGYYVKVRTYKKVNGEKYYSSWSKVKSVRTKG